MSLGKIWENSNSARTFAFRFLNANPNDKCLFSQFSEEEKRKILSRSFVWKLLLSVEVFSIQNVHNNISFTLVSYADAVSQQKIERLKRLQSFPWLFPLDINLNEKIVPHDLLTLLSTKKNLTKNVQHKFPLLSFMFIFIDLNNFFAIFYILTMLRHAQW